MTGLDGLVRARRALAWLEVLADHDLDRADVLAMLRAPGDAVLDALADDLAGAWSASSTGA